VQNNSLINVDNIQAKIFTMRGKQVMIDRDLAKLYHVETKVLNQSVKRNISRFPHDFMFKLTKEELDNWRSQIVTSNKDKMGLRHAPYAFTEHGVSMLASVIRSQKAVEINIQIIRAFVNYNKIYNNNSILFSQLLEIKENQKHYKIKIDQKFKAVFKAIRNKQLSPKQGIFYDGQVFDAYVLISDIIRLAKNSIVIIDNYIDDTVLKQLIKRRQNVKVIIYTKEISELLKQDVQRYNAQYPNIIVKKLTTTHDRFMIIDSKVVYHFGASLKDAGKKWFAFSKLDIDANDILRKL